MLFSAAAISDKSEADSVRPVGFEGLTQTTTLVRGEIERLNASASNENPVAAGMRYEIGIPPAIRTIVGYATKPGSGIST